MRVRMLAFVGSAVMGVIVGLGPQTPDVRAATTPAYTNISPARLQEILRRKDFRLVNVHIPYEGEIAGTDLFIPYDEVGTKAPTLLPDRQATIVVYCRTGPMSAIAANALVRLGYTRVLNLAGGMVAWERAGYFLKRR